MEVPLFTWLEIETQGDCNRTCSTCLRQSYPNKDHPTHKGRMPVTSKVGGCSPSAKMPTDTFKRIIDEAVEMGFTGSVNLQHFNEPLLDERLTDLARYVKTKSEITEVGAYTNMDLITEERAKEMDGIFDYFVVALYMSEEKQKKREPWIRGLFKKTRLKFTKGVHIVTHHSPPSCWNGIINFKAPARNLEELIRTQVETPCTDYNDKLIIAYDGTILHCCEDYVGHFGLGNVNSMSLKDIWESETHTELVGNLACAGGRKKYSYCSNCPR